MFHRPPVLHRLFFALRPPLPLARRIAASAEWFGVRPVAAERLHVTLFPLDLLAMPSAALVGRMRAAGALVACPPFEVVLDRVVGTGRSVALRPRVRLPGLAGLRRSLVEGARTAGVAERDGYRFAPHMTLGYGGTVPFDRPVSTVAWTADEIVLIDSHHGRTRHEEAGRWALSVGNGGSGDARQPDLFGCGAAGIAPVADVAGAGSGPSA